MGFAGVGWGIDLKLGPKADCPDTPTLRTAGGWIKMVV